MKKLLKNKKGFTLVELLAVIVILALIMSIAIVSMSGIMQSARESTFKETALQIINGVNQQLTLANETNPGVAEFSSANGVDYYFTQDIIEKGGDVAPLGGNVKYIATPAAADIGEGKTYLRKIGNMGIYRSSANGTCAADQNSFVRVKYNTSTRNFEYSICLTAGAGYKYIDVTNGTQAKLLDSNDTTMILPQ